MPAPAYKMGELVATREAYGTALAELGALDPRVVALDADVNNSTFSDRFEKSSPDRFYQAFIAEQVMVGAAMGLAAAAPSLSVDVRLLPDRAAVMIELAEEGMTMVCVTHEMGFARTVADMMVFMDRGEIVERAPPTEFFANPKSERTRLFLSEIFAH